MNSQQSSSSRNTPHASHVIKAIIAIIAGGLWINTPALPAYNGDHDAGAFRFRVGLQVAHITLNLPGEDVQPRN